MTKRLARVPVEGSGRALLRVGIAISCVGTALLVWQTARGALLEYCAQANIGLIARSRVVHGAIKARYPALALAAPWNYDNFDNYPYGQRVSASGFVFFTGRRIDPSQSDQIDYLLDESLRLIGVIHSYNCRIDQPIDHDGAPGAETIIYYRCCYGRREWICSAIVQLGLRRHLVRAVVCEPASESRGRCRAVWDYQIGDRANVDFRLPIRGLAVCGALCWARPGQLELIGRIPAFVWIPRACMSMSIAADEPVERGLSRVFTALFPGRGNWY